MTQAIKPLSIALLALAALSSCSSEGSESSEQQGTNPDDLPRIETSNVEILTVEHTSSYTANVEADKTNNITSSIPNRIKQILVDVGSTVTKGQKLVVLDDVTIEQSRVRLENARREYERAVKLYEVGGGTRQSVDQLKTELDAQTRAYENQLENTILTSPVAGTVTARNYDPGDIAGQLPILVVEQINPVKIMIGISETDFASIHRGMPVTITLDAYPGETFQGEVAIVHPTIDPATRTFLTEVTIPNPSHRILPGMFARAEISLGSVEAVVVPDRAVVRQSGSAVEYVYVYNPADSTVAFTTVTLGRRLPESNSYEVVEGLPDGTTVVISGQSRLVDGAKAINLRQ